MQRLTDCELELIRLGYLPIKEAANVLCKSQGTIKNTRSNITHKLDAINYYHAIAIFKAKVVTKVY